MPWQVFLSLFLLLFHILSYKIFDGIFCKTVNYWNQNSCLKFQIINLQIQVPKMNYFVLTYRKNSKKQG